MYKQAYFIQFKHFVKKNFTSKCKRLLEGSRHSKTIKLRYRGRGISRRQTEARAPITLYNVTARISA